MRIFRFAITALAAVLLAATPSYAQRADATHQFTQFTEANCEGATPCDSSTGSFDGSVFCLSSMRTTHRVELDVGGTVTTCTVNVQGSGAPDGLFGVISTTGGSDTTCTSDTVIQIVDAPVRCFKVVVTGFAGTSQTLDVWLGSVSYSR